MSAKLNKGLNEFIRGEEYLMSGPVFVARETELNKLKSFLDEASTGKTQVVFIAGEAGAGKSSLITEFIRRQAEVDTSLISVMGVCNAQTGVADPYLPFRQILTALTAEDDEKKSPNKSDERKLSHWKEFVQVSQASLSRPPVESLPAVNS
jgi:predicted ATPase